MMPQSNNTLRSDLNSDQGKRRSARRSLAKTIKLEVL